MKKYFITPNGYDFKFDNVILEHGAEYILYRDKSNSQYDKRAEEFIKECKKYNNVKSYIHQNVDLAYQLKATGVHLTSQQFDKIKYAKNLDLEVIVSTHTYDEVLEVEALGADYVTYSPIFFSPGKGDPKGIEDLEVLLENCNIKVFALGGIISSKESEKIAQTKAYGFASIRYFL